MKMNHLRVKGPVPHESLSDVRVVPWHNSTWFLINADFFPSIKHPQLTQIHAQANRSIDGRRAR